MTDDNPGPGGDDERDAAVGPDGPYGGEWTAVEESDRPVTVDRLLSDLAALGLAAGDDVIVHSSMQSLGWVPGGAPAVVDALTGTVTDAGTLVMPTHTSHYADPSEWENPPLPDDWVPTVRETMPAYRPEVTPTRGMGSVAECFRSYPGAVRSDHPIYSFAAWGKRAGYVAEGHELGYGMGEGSPLARLYDVGGRVLLLGVGHGRNTSLHLAEYRAGVTGECERGAPVLVDGQRRWKTFPDVRVDDGDFADLGRAFERERPEAVESGRVGNASATLVDQVALVDFAVDWLRENRE